METKSEVIKIRIEPSKRQLIESLAMDEGISLSDWMREAIEYYLDSFYQPELNQQTPA